MKKISREAAERAIYIIIVAVLVVYGIFEDTEAAETLIRAIKEAFSILIQ